MLHVWGCGQFGQHGHGHVKNVSSENCALKLKDEETVKMISCGSSHSISISGSNKLYGWGNNGTQQLGLVAKQHVYPKPVPIPVLNSCQVDEIVGVSCGSRQSVVWTKSGKCFCYGKLGSMHKNCDQEASPDHLASFLGNLTVKEISCGSSHAIFCLQDGKALTVGSNNRGQLGNGTKIESGEPVFIEDIQAVITHVACGNMHTLCLTEENGVYNWGYGQACGCEDDIMNALAVGFEDDKEKLVKLQGGDGHSIALTNDGKVLGWGSNSEGQLGIADSKKLIESPVCITELKEKGICIDISARDDTNAAVLENGDVYMWGRNLWGVLEGGSSLNSSVAKVFKVDLDVVKASKVSLGSWHVGVIARDKMMECFRNDDGGGGYEELAQDGRTQSTTDVSKIEDDSGVVRCNEFEEVIKVEIKVDRHRAGSNKSTKEDRCNAPGPTVSESELPDKGADKNNNFEEKVQAVRAGKLRGKEVGRSLGQIGVLDKSPREGNLNDISKAFSTASITLRNQKSITDGNKICSFVSFSGEDSLLKTKYGKGRNSRYKDSNHLIRRGILSKSLSSDGTFITKLQSRSPVRQGNNFQEVKPSTWNSEMLLEMTSHNFRIGSNETFESRRAKTAAKLIRQKKLTFERSKSLEIMTTTQESRWQLPKLKDKTQSKYSKLLYPSEHKDCGILKGNMSRITSAAKEFSTIKRNKNS